jgi:preprotein translocase subunit YajC
MILANAGAGGQASGAAGGGFMIIWLVVLVALMYFMMIRPQKKEQKRVQAMLNDMHVGDAVVTSGGFYGIIIDITDEDVIVEFGNNKNCRIPMRKSAISEVERQSEAVETKEPDTKPAQPKESKKDKKQKKSKSNEKK